MLLKFSHKLQQKKLLPNKYVKYIGFAFQMIAVFVGLSLGGNWLDRYWGFNFPYLTLTGVFLAIAAVFVSLFSILKSDDTK